MRPISCHRNRSIGRRVTTCLCIMLVVGGCRPSDRAGDAAAPRARQDQPSENAGQGPTAVVDETPPASGATGDNPPSPAQRRLPGRPAPTAVCGHAVAFAGWKPSADGTSDLLRLLDPGDNRLEELGHVWEGRAREVPLHYGRRRPSVVLLPGGAFTVTGAVVIVPAGSEEFPPRIEATVVSGMPDLSQDFNPRWPGLCGPTAAADTFYAIHARGRPVLQGFARGSRSDAAAERLIAGGWGEITAESLAGRMGIGPEGNGATNVGLRDGCHSWLVEQAPDAWKVELLWLDDDVRDSGRQRAFVGRLATALSAGGGAILCLWPGTEFSDAAAGEADDQQASGVDQDVADPEERSRASQTARPGEPPAVADERQPRRSPRPELPDAEFPALPAPAAPNRGFRPGQPNLPDDPAAAAVRAGEKRRAAESRLDRGDFATALALATQGIELLVGPARSDAACREELDRLLSVCAEIEARLPASPSLRTDRPTVYE
jgi:hypothetical protein